MAKAFPSLTRQDIEQGLRELGLRRGDAIEVHSSLKSIGWVEGGAATVVDALMNVVGERGAIVMSAYALSPPLPLTAKEQARGIRAKVRLLGDDAHARTGMGPLRMSFATEKRPFWERVNIRSARGDETPTCMPGAMDTCWRLTVTCCCWA